jgi:hypothetical protein
MQVPFSAPFNFAHSVREMFVPGHSQGISAAAIGSNSSTQKIAGALLESSKRRKDRAARCHTLGLFTKEKNFSQMSSPLLPFQECGSAGVAWRS